MTKRPRTEKRFPWLGVSLALLLLVAATVAAGALGGLLANYCCSAPARTDEQRSQAQEPEHCEQVPSEGAGVMVVTQAE